MKQLRFSMVTVCVLMLVSQLNAQNFAEDLAAINRAYFNLHNHIELKTVVKKDGAIETSQTVHSYMRGIDDYFMKNMSSEVLIQSGLRVAVNTDFKVVLVDSNAKESLTSLPVSLFDTISNIYSSITYTSISNDKALYTLIPKFGESKSVKIYFWKATKLIEKVEVKLQNPKNNSSYLITNTYKYSKLKSSDIPNLSKYLTRDNTGNYKLHSNWSTYEFVNNIAP